MQPVRPPGRGVRCSPRPHTHVAVPRPFCTLRHGGGGNSAATAAAAAATRDVTATIAAPGGLWAARAAQLGAVAALGATMVLCRPEPAAAGLLPRLFGRGGGQHHQQQQQQVSAQLVSPQPVASVTAAVGSGNNCLALVVVCFAFWFLSATISAAIGAVMHLSGRSLRSAARGGASWSSAGILDTFDIMRLPLAYELDEPAARQRPAPAGAGAEAAAETLYLPWEGPEGSLIPVGSLKVLRPGLREAGLVARPGRLPPPEQLRIIAVTRRAGGEGGEGGEGGGGSGSLLSSNGNGNGASGNGNGNGNGRGGASPGGEGGEGGRDGPLPQPPATN